MAATKYDRVTEYYEAIRNAYTEAIKKEIFFILLTRLFGPFDHFDIIGQIVNGEEKAIANIQRTGKPCVHAMVHAQYGNVIIEFENDLRPTGPHAKDLLKGYFSAN